MTSSEACTIVHGLLEAGGDEDGAIEIPWDVYYAFQDIDPNNVDAKDKKPRWFDAVLIQAKLDQMENKIVKRVTERIIREQGTHDGME